MALLTGALMVVGVAVANAATLRLTPVGTFKRPIQVVAPPGDTHRLFVVERGWSDDDGVLEPGEGPGRVLVILDGQVQSTPYLEIGTNELLTHLSTSGGEGGLLSIAFAPDYATSGHMYVLYSDRARDIRVQEFTRSADDPDRADPASRREVIRIAHREGVRHYGGQLRFGPDGRLYISTGDAGNSAHAQDLSSLLGKILRIDPHPSGDCPPGAPPSSACYTVPRDDPYAGPTPGANQIWAYGFRNPYSLSFDRATGDLWVADVGAQTWEEIDTVTQGAGLGRGSNFGWNLCEGSYARGSTTTPCSLADQVSPVLEYPHTAGRCAVIGGSVMRDPFVSVLEGRYVYGDYCTGAIRTIIDASGDNRWTGLTVAPKTLYSFGEDACGRMYVTQSTGQVSRIEDDTPGSCGG